MMFSLTVQKPSKLHAGVADVKKGQDKAHVYLLSYRTMGLP